MLRTRFAPSPTGYLHTGNAYSALLCAQWAKEQHAELILRIEDIDFTRCRPEFSSQTQEDLAWLGIAFTGEVVYQQQRLQFYQQALDTLIEMGVLYPCYCSRKHIQTTLSSSTNHRKMKLDPYPRTCRQLPTVRQAMMQGKASSWRLNQGKVVEILGSRLSWVNANGQTHDFEIQSYGDVIVGRKDIQFSYHLSVVVDDYLQGITHVIRGEDLRESTAIHIILQRLLAYPHPFYQHHPLISDASGQRLAKSKQSVSIKSLRESGVAATDFRSTLASAALSAILLPEHSQ